MSARVRPSTSGHADRNASFDDVSLTELRKRRSAKWRTYPADVLPAFVAEMDFPLAEPIKDALLNAVDLGDTGYPHPAGVAEAFVGFAQDWFDWSPPPDRVAVVPDVLVGVAEMLRLLTAPGDRVVMNTPAYPPFWPVIREYGREVVEVPLARTPNGWDLDFTRLEAAFADGATAYLLCNPHNPTGRVFTRAQLETIAKLADRYGIAIVADEIHAPLTLPGAVHTPFVALGNAAAQRAVTVTSASKAFNLPGLKCAVAVAGSDAVRARFADLPHELHVRAGHFGLIASIAAFTHGRPWLRALVAHIDRNRHFLADLLGRRLPDVGYLPPEASYLAWLDCAALGLGSDPAPLFLEHGRVALSRGLDFGAESAGFVRLNIGTSSHLMAEAVARMATAVASIQHAPTEHEPSVPAD
jgi:cysteine-S-conjugate beta-lyase